MSVLKMVVRISCLPEQTQKELEALRQALVAALVREQIEIHGEDDVMVLLSADMMAYGLGKDILVEYLLLPAPPNVRPAILKQRLAQSLRAFLQQRFPNAHVQDFFPLGENFPPPSDE